MDSYLLAALVVGALVVVVLGLRSAKHPVEPSIPEQRESSQPVTLSEEERLVQEAAAVQAHWAEELRVVERSHGESLRPLVENRKKALKMVAESGVQESACYVIETMGYWPSWSKRADWTMPLSVAGLDGGNLDRGSGKWLGWTWENVSFRLELTRNYSSFGYSDDNVHGEVKLAVAGVLVMHLHVKQVEGPDYNTPWRVSSVDALRAGAWMPQLNELAGRLRVASTRQSHERTMARQVEVDRQIELN